MAPQHETEIHMADILTRIKMKSLSWRAAKKAPRVDPTVFVIDPGCTAGFGHHRSINQIIYDDCTRRKHAIEIYTGRMDEPEAPGFAPQAVFSDVVYEGIPDSADAARSKIKRLNKTIFNELNENLPSLTPDDRVIIHTASVTMLQGLADWLQVYAKPGMIVSIVMMLVPYSNPGRKAVSDESRAVIDEAYRQSFAALRALPIELKIFAETREMAAAYESIAGGPVAISPLPIEFHHHSGADESEPSDAEPVFLFAGDSRPEKGILLMPDAIELYYERGGQGRFIIQCGEPPKEQGPKAEALAKLQALSPKVALETRSFDGPDYFRFLNQGDILLAPYNPAFYGTIRPSRILLEGLGLGKPVVTSAGTWMETTLRGLDRPCGTVLTQFTAEALCTALLEADRQRQDLTRNARQISDSIRQAHNEAAYLQTVLQRST